MPGRFRALVVEIHRRSLWQVLGIYLVGAWISYEVVLGLTEGLGLPDWVPPLAIVLFVIGLPIVLATAFIQEGLPGQDRAGDAGAGTSGRVAEASLLSQATARQDEPGAGSASAHPSDPAPPPNAQPAPAPKRAVPHLFTWRGAITAGVLAFAVLGLASVGFMAMRSMGVGPMGSLVGRGELAPEDPVLVADFTPLTGDSALARLVAEAVRVDLSQSELLNVVDRSLIAQVLERMGRDPGTALEPDVAREIAIRLGLKAVVEGEVGASHGQFLLTASLVTPDSGRALATFRETAADSTDLLAAVGRLSHDLREKAGESLTALRASAPLARVTTSSLPALRKFVAAREAERRGDRSTAMGLMSQALELDPDFARAHGSMAVFLYNRGQRSDTMFAHARRAVELGERLTDQERHHARAFYALARYDLDGAAEEYRTLLAMDSTDVVALINLGHLLDLFDEYEEAEELTRRAARLGDRGISTTYWNLNRTLYAQGKFDEAVEWIERARQDHPESGALQHMRWLVEMQRGDYDAVEALLDSAGEGFRVRHILYQLARGRVSDARATAEGMPQPPDPGFRLFAAMINGYTDHWILQRSDAADSVLRVLEDPSLDTIPPGELPLPHVAALLAATGRTREARDVAARFRDGVIPEMLGQYQGLLLLAKGLAQIADGRHEPGFATLASAQRAAPCRACLGAHIGRAYEQAGRADEAIDWYTRYLEAPWADRYDLDVSLPAVGVWLQAPTHERLARLLEERGERDKAAAHYAAFLEMWQDADPELQPRVRAARAALERLSAER